MGISKTAVVRADAYTQIGMGHVMRCLALAQGLEKNGVSSIFVIRNYDRKIKELIQRHGYNVETIPEYCSSKEDLRLTLEFAGRHRAKLIITDLCHAGTLTNQAEYGAYLQGLKDKSKFLVTIDDLNEMSFPSDIVINPNCGAENKTYPSGSVKYLLGPAYFMFRPEFIAAAGAKREIQQKAANVLIAMSGSDPLDLTGKAAGAFTASEKTRNLNLRFILGIDYTVNKKRNLKNIFENYRGTYEFIQESKNIADLMLWADIAITGAGLTKYEAAVTGTPCIIIPAYAYLVKLAEEFAAAGSAINLGLAEKLADKEIADAAYNLLVNAPQRTEMSKKGKKLVDSRGVERIISEIPQDVWL
jgi:UDP-2,4-diacetamido-2,4,6-trideoxy-beta-L-altropyranose hydrolase